MSKQPPRAGQMAGGRRGLCRSHSSLSLGKRFYCGFIWVGHLLREHRWPERAGQRGGAAGDIARKSGARRAPIARLAEARKLDSHPRSPPSSHLLSPLPTHVDFFILLWPWD